MAVAFVSIGAEASGFGSANIAMPGSRVIGNIVVATIRINNVGATMGSTPAGWTKRVETNQAAIYTHTIDGTESWFAAGGTVNFTCSGSAQLRCVAAQYGGVNAAAPIGEIVTGVAAGASGATLPVLSLVASVPAGAMVVFTSASSTGVTVTGPSGYTDQAPGAVRTHVYTKALGAPETPTNVFITHSTSDTWVATLFSLVEPAAATNATVNAVAATATATAHAPAVTGKRFATIAAVVATTAAAALAPVPHGAARVTPPAAAATATAQTPGVLGVRNVTIHPPDAAASVGALSPIISAVGSATVTVPGLAAATAQTNNPTVTATRNATVQAVTAAATAAGLAPTPRGGARVTAPTATATAGTLSPVILGQQNGTVLAVAATATADTPAPAVEVRVPSEPPPAERIYIIDASDRTVTIAHSNRTVTIAASNRTIGVRP